MELIVQIWRFFPKKILKTLKIWQLWHFFFFHKNPWYALHWIFFHQRKNHAIRMRLHFVFSFCYLFIYLDRGNLFLFLFLNLGVFAFLPFLWRWWWWWWWWWAKTNPALLSFEDDDDEQTCRFSVADTKDILFSFSFFAFWKKIAKENAKHVFFNGKSSLRNFC